MLSGYLGDPGVAARVHDVAGRGVADDLARRRATTVLLVTHEARVAAYSDRDVTVRDGRARDLEHAV